VFVPKFHALASQYDARVGSDWQATFVAKLFAAALMSSSIKVPESRGSLFLFDPI